MGKIKQAIPHLFTLGNLSMGVLAVLMIFKGTNIYATYLVFFAADGREIRRINNPSSTTTIHSNDFKAGLYIYRLFENGAPIVSGKFSVVR